MPVLLSDETWKRIEAMLIEYERGGMCRVVPGTGLKYEETPGGVNEGGTSSGKHIGTVIIGVDGVECP
jgi:hypothetical protein